VISVSLFFDFVVRQNVGDRNGDLIGESLKTSNCAV
jgi:hypothetical protein